MQSTSPKQATKSLFAEYSLLKLTGSGFGLLLIYHWRMIDENNEVITLSGFSELIQESTIWEKDFIVINDAKFTLLKST